MALLVTYFLICLMRCVNLLFRGQVLLVLDNGGVHSDSIGLRFCYTLKNINAKKAIPLDGLQW
jgi:hypothetical protein